jgi:glycosyltransferase involved in cell wall biosynthesis
MARIARQDLGRWLVVGEPVYGDEKRRLLLDASAFLYPSRWDACPNSVLESVSLGIPTLCTPYPLGTYLADRGGAVLAEASVPGLAAALVELRDHDRLGRTGAAGAEVARRDLRWDAVASSWLGQVEGLLGAAIPTGSRRGAPPGQAPTEDPVSA